MIAQGVVNPTTIPSRSRQSLDTQMVPL